MCQFKSAIVIREPRNKGGFALVHSFASDSHSELIRANKLRDDGKLRFARVEFVPGNDWTDLKSYKLRIDEERADACHSHAGHSQEASRGPPQVRLRPRLP